MANGGIAGAIVIVQYFFPDLDLYPVYLGSVAAVTADTWGTEIGILVRGKVILISKLKTAAPGTNGGISIAGSFAGMAGALIIALSGYAWLKGNNVIPVIVFGGMIGSIVDSIMGSAIQARSKCRICSKLTERAQHCGEKTEFIGGVCWINNDIVNIYCALSGTLTTYLFLS